MLYPLQQNQNRKEQILNENFSAVDNGATGSYKFNTTTGLTWGYYGGNYFDDNGDIQDIPDGTITLANNATNYIELDVSTGVISSNTSAFTVGDDIVPLYIATTVSGQITDKVNKKCSVGKASGGGGGGTGNGNVKMEEFTLPISPSGFPQIFDQYIHNLNPMGDHAIPYLAKVTIRCKNVSGYTVTGAYSFLFGDETEFFHNISGTYVPAFCRMEADRVRVSAEFITILGNFMDYKTLNNATDIPNFEFVIRIFYQV